MGSAQGAILITGGAGYIGSHTCKVLARHGYRPLVLDNLEHGHRAAIKWGDFEHADLRDRDALQRVFERHDIDAVVHFAAYAYVGASVLDPGLYYRNNVLGSLNLLDAMRAAGVDTLVFSSSCATYGIPGHTPIDEQTEQRPINPYGHSKLMVERLLDDYCRAYGMRACSLRYFNAAGADPDGELGELHDPEPHLVPNVLRAAAGLQRLRVYGDDYATPDGTCIRDYIHVVDLAEAHRLALEYLPDHPGSHAFNLGAGCGHSVMEIRMAAELQLGVSVPCDFEPRRPGDPPVLVADTTRAAAQLGWRPRYSELSEILRTAWQWQQAGARFDQAPG